MWNTRELEKKWIYSLGKPRAHVLDGIQRERRSFYRICTMPVLMQYHDSYKKYYTIFIHASNKIIHVIMTTRLAYITQLLS